MLELENKRVLCKDCSLNFTNLTILCHFHKKMDY